MTHIVVEWIKDKIGANIPDDLPILTEFIRNGHLIALILSHFNLITDEQASVILSSDVTNELLVKSNFRTIIVPWLLTINIRLTNEEIDNLNGGSVEEAIQLLFKIYLELRFLEDEVPHELGNCNCYTQTKITQNDILFWHKTQLDQLLYKCRHAKNYLESINGKK